MSMLNTLLEIDFSKLIIIVEGPDCAGKTTVCNLLHLITDFPVKHLTQNDPAILDTYMNILKESDIILDRFYFSEFVYSTVVRCGNTTLHAEDVMKIKERMSELTCLIIHVTNTKEVLVARARDRGEDYVNEEQLCRIKDTYELLFSSVKHIRLELNL